VKHSNTSHLDGVSGSDILQYTDKTEYINIKIHFITTENIQKVEMTNCDIRSQADADNFKYQRANKTETRYKLAKKHTH